MKTIIFISILLSTLVMAEERAFRVERYYDTVNGLAVAWGIPGKKLDFEKLDKMSIEEIESTLDVNAIKNFIVDLETNQVIYTVENSDYVSFNIAGMHFGEFYSISLNNLKVENMPVNTEVITIIENYKWSNQVSKILYLDRNDQNQIKTTVVDALEIFNTLQKKLRESILEKNLDLFDNGAFNLNNMETKFVENKGDVTQLTFDYSFPKSDKNALEVIVQAKFKYTKGKIVPYILSVKQKQY